jgi:hypothetical protein
MLSLRNCAWLTMAMAFVSLAALLCSHLALTGIYHGEPDQTSEWAVLQASARILIVFIAMTVFTLARVLRSAK